MQPTKQDNIVEVICEFKHTHSVNTVTVVVVIVLLQKDWQFSMLKIKWTRFVNYKVGIFPEISFSFLSFHYKFFSDSTQQRDYRHATENDQQIQPITSHKRDIKFFRILLISCVRVSEAGNINLYICFALHTLWYAPLMSTSFIKIILEFWIRCKLDTCNERFIFILMSDAHVWANFEYSNISRLDNI